MITGRQIRIARGILGWSERELARNAGVRVFTVRNIENDLTDEQLPGLSAIRAVLEAHGIVFTAAGVRSSAR
jgi:transcriptional regulator with XRE-family HTH domain